ncbi:hypothetical protein EDB81DRAFT_463531 [Dactylonectria macrodidyma]|uniref:Uncharacterized protein n=1 Tax=Dactylonectria macrodidyma TaxID=307937 RepID=A0A9P9EXW2_9HYPO|nr:hypothetical protein EDB81DRAFT_463531 [Dactylonectria macrodidyma]
MNGMCGWCAQRKSETLVTSRSSEGARLRGCQVAQVARSKDQRCRIQSVVDVAPKDVCIGQDARGTMRVRFTASSSYKGAVNAESRRQRRMQRPRQRKVDRIDAERKRVWWWLGGRRESCSFKLMKLLQKAAGAALGDWHWGAKLGGSCTLSGPVALLWGVWQLGGRRLGWLLMPRGTGLATRLPVSDAGSDDHHPVSPC